MTTDIKNHPNNNREKDFRASFTLQLSARQGDLLKEILLREQTDARTRGKDRRVQEISTILMSVQNALDQADYFVGMRKLPKRKNL